MLEFFTALFGIIFADLLLSGDNAVVIALVTRQLPKHQQRIGIAAGATAAVLLRIIFALIISTLISIEGLRLVGGIFLVYIAAKLLFDEEGGDEKPAATTLMKAVIAIAIADVGMSLDNVIAVAALAHGNDVLLISGIVISIPFVIVGAAVISAIVEKFPIIVWFGAALLGWVAGSIMIEDPYVIRMLADWHDAVSIATPIITTAIVLIAGVSAMISRHVKVLQEAESGS